MDDIARPKAPRPTPMAGSQPGQTPMPARTFGNDILPAQKTAAPVPAPAPTVPRPVAITTPEAKDETEEALKPVFSDGGPAMDAPASEAVTTQPQNGAGLDLSSLSSDDANDLGLAPTEPTESSKKDDDKKQMYPTGQPKKHGRGGVIIAAVLIALCLIGGAGYAYWQNSSKSTPAPTSTEKTNNGGSASGTASGSDIDSASKDLDASLNKVNDTSEFTSTDLADTTLGL